MLRPRQTTCEWQVCGPESHALTPAMDFTSHFTPDLEEPGRGKTIPSTRCPGDLPAGGGLPDALGLPTWEGWLPAPRVGAGCKVVAAGVGAEAGFAAAIQLLLQLQSQAVVHLDALLQLPSQSSDLRHQVAQVTARGDQVTGVPGVS